MLQKIRFFLLLLCAIVFSPAFAQQNDFKPELDTLFQSFKTRRYELIKPLLDPNVKIGPLPQGMNDLVVPQILKQLPEPSSYVVSSVVKEGDSTRVETTYTYGDRALKQTFVFNAAHKVTSLDLPGKAKAIVANPNTATRVMPDKLEVPFELHNHIIFVKAELNGKTENFILDSGAPILVLNADHVSPEQLHGAGSAIGVGGQVDVKGASVKTFDWQGLKIDGFEAVAMSLGHLAKDAGTDFVGLIGYDVFKDYEVTFDYKRKLITLIRTDKDGTPIEKAMQSLEGTSVVPFEMHRHIPVFPMKIGDKTYQMGLDSGAGGNLLAAKYWPDVQKNATPIFPKTLDESKIRGIGKEGVQARLATIDNATVGTMPYKNMGFAFEDSTLAQLNAGYGLNIDGLLGYEFLQQYVTSVNFKKGEMRIYPATPATK